MPRRVDAGAGAGVGVGVALVAVGAVAGAVSEHAVDVPPMTMKNSALASACAVWNVNASPFAHRTVCHRR